MAIDPITGEEIPDPVTTDPTAPAAPTVPTDPTAPAAPEPPALPSSNPPTPDAFVPTDADVSAELTKVLDTNSPLITRARTGAKQAANRRGLLNSSIAVGAGESAALDVALPIAAQNAAQRHQANLQGRDIETQRGLQATDIRSRELISNLDRDVQERIANLNVAAHDREKATASSVAFANIYGDMYRTIVNNTSIPAADRELALEHILNMRDQNLGLLEQLYDFDLVWNNNAAPPAPV